MMTMVAKIIFSILVTVQIATITTTEDDTLSGCKCGSKRDATDSISMEWSE